MTRTTSGAGADRRKAWWSLALLPVGFVAAFVVGEGLLALYGQEPHADQMPPWWAVMGAGVPALVVFAVPMLVTLHFGRRAVAAGDDRARVPMTIAVVITVVFMLQNAVAFLLG